MLAADPIRKRPKTVISINRGGAKDAGSIAFRPARTPAVGFGFGGSKLRHRGLDRLHVKAEAKTRGVAMRNGKAKPSFDPSLKDVRLRRDVRRLLTRYRDRGEVVRYSVLMTRIHARSTFMRLTRAKLMSIVAGEALRTGLVMEFDRDD